MLRGPMCSATSHFDADFMRRNLVTVHAAVTHIRAMSTDIDLHVLKGDPTSVVVGLIDACRHGDDPASQDPRGADPGHAAGSPEIAHCPTTGAERRTLVQWVASARPKVDRIACPWLIRRFVDPEAEFLYVPAGEVIAVAERTGAIP